MSWRSFHTTSLPSYVLEGESSVTCQTDGPAPYFEQLACDATSMANQTLILTFVFLFLSFLLCWLVIIYIRLTTRR
jgi:hypothetical protein